MGLFTMLLLQTSSKSVVKTVELEAEVEAEEPMPKVSVDFLRTRIDNFVPVFPVHDKVHVVSTSEEWEKALVKLQAGLQMYNVIGLDCEWMSDLGLGDDFEPEDCLVALLQLATLDGTVALVRMGHLRHIPESFRCLLLNTEVPKVGINIAEDCRRMYQDYQVMINRAIDLRLVYGKVFKVDVQDSSFSQTHKLGLQGLAMELMGVNIPKGTSVIHSDWFDVELSRSQISYAATDAILSVQISAVLGVLLLEAQGQLDVASLDDLNAAVAGLMAHFTEETEFKVKKGEIIVSCFGFSKSRLSVLSEISNKCKMIYIFVSG